MSHKANPKLIGAFVTASGALLVAMVLFFGSSSLLSQSTRFILFFDQSVNGLNVGSPVKFRGVPVGSVERILIRADGQRTESNAIPVIIKIDHSRIERDLGLMKAHALDSESIQDFLAKGLIARLSIESFITGQLFVEFSVEPDKVMDYQPHLVGSAGLVEIPALASSLDEITADVGQLIADFGAIDLPRLNENVNAVLESMTTVLAGIDAGEISRTVTEAAKKVTEVVGSEDFNGSLAEMRQAFAVISKTAESYDLQGGPLGEAIQTWTVQLKKTLDGLDQMITQTSGMLAPESDLRFELQNTMRELSRAAQSIRELTDYLESNPNALITGRPESED